MKWNISELEQFFGCEGERSIPHEDKVDYFFRYSSNLLQYEFIVHPEDQQVSVSADTENPFGADSLYEIYVPCDCIEFFPDPYREGHVGIVCWYGSSENQSNRSMTILKRTDGDLKVWPDFRFPPNHPTHRS